MPSNLKARLSQIREAGRSNAGGSARENGSGKVKENPKGILFNPASWPFWKEAGFMTLKREISLKLPAPQLPAFPLGLPSELAVLVPDFIKAGAGCMPAPGELVFFDLETTGLSGGAGTIAFLSAFGRFAGNDGLNITQYLLLDYPGEADFVELAVRELSPSGGNGVLPFIVSYNGKCFDSQILKTRCLMNGIAPPQYFHVDLLHPARRLWKKQLSDCSQATIEVSALGLDRSGDIPGAFAPDIWFSFLRSGNNRELLSVCDHNMKDIKGLARLFLAFAEIAAAPMKLRNRYQYDIESLALAWRAAVKKGRIPFGAGESSQSCAETGELLLKTAAESGSCRAAIALAINAEWRLNDPAMALSYAVSALENIETPEIFRDGLEKRRKRLEGKIRKQGRFSMLSAPDPNPR